MPASQELPQKEEVETIWSAPVAAPAPAPATEMEEKADEMVARVLAFSENAGSYQDLVRSLETADGFVRTQVSRETFQRDSRTLRKRMASTRNGLINPRSPMMSYWDLTTGTALVYTATITPFEICLSLPTEPNALFFVNQVVNLIFMVDIVIQFFLPVPDEHGEFIRNRLYLWKRYLKGWFTIDVISILPLDLVAVSGDGIDPGLRSIRLLRVFRLLKLVRVLRASRIIQRWQNAIDISSSQLSLVTILLSYAIFVHWFACFWAMIPQLYGSWRYAPGFEERLLSRAATDPTCTGCLPKVGGVAQMVPPHLPNLACNHTLLLESGTEPCLTSCEISVVAEMTFNTVDHIHNTEHWLCRSVAAGLLPIDYEQHPFLTWLISMEIAVLQFAGSVGSVGPANGGEFVAYLISLTAGLLIFSAVQAIFVRMLTTSDPDETYFSQSLDALNFMMRDTRMPGELRTRVRDYFRKSKKLIKRLSYDELIDRCLSKELRGDTRYQISHHLFRQVWWLDACERSYLEDLSIFLRREAFEGHSPISSEECLSILVQGVATRAGTIITAGTAGGSWGDILIQSKRLRDTRQARALSYCEVAQISRVDLFRTVQDYPESLMILREAALKLATWRAVMIISAFVRLTRNATASRASTPMPNGRQTPSPAPTITVGSPDGSLGTGGNADSPGKIKIADNALLRSLHAEVFSVSDEPTAPFREIDAEGNVVEDGGADEDKLELPGSVVDSRGNSFRRIVKDKETSFTKSKIPLGNQSPNQAKTSGMSFGKKAQRPSKEETGEMGAVLKEMHLARESRAQELRELREMRSEMRREQRAIREAHEKALNRLDQRLAALETAEPPLPSTPANLKA